MAGRCWSEVLTCSGIHQSRKGEVYERSSGGINGGASNLYLPLRLLRAATTVVGSGGFAIICSAQALYVLVARLLTPLSLSNDGPI
jgi:hypothetical protein